MRLIPGSYPLTYRYPLWQVNAHTCVSTHQHMINACGFLFNSKNGTELPKFPAWEFHESEEELNSCHRGGERRMPELKATLLSPARSSRRHSSLLKAPPRFLSNLSHTLLNLQHPVTLSCSVPTSETKS